MAEVTGPISTLSGAYHNLPAGTMCDAHSNRPAVARVQGETDSFGSELNDMCQECFDEHKAYVPPPSTCDWCKTPNVKVRDMRDYEEGMCGRVYEVCDECRARYNQSLADEANYYDNDY